MATWLEEKHVLQKIDDLCGHDLGVGFDSLEFSVPSLWRMYKSGWSFLIIF